MLASGSSDNTIRFWDVKTGECIYIVTTCPDSQWIVYSQSSVFYSSSPRGGDYASIRFDDKLRSLYPLKQYPELKIPEGASLSRLSQAAAPSSLPQKMTGSGGTHDSK
jgi:WD40 repeat protein